MVNVLSSLMPIYASPRFYRPTLLATISTYLSYECQRRCQRGLSLFVLWPRERLMRVIVRRATRCGGIRLGVGRLGYNVAHPSVRGACLERRHLRGDADI